MPAPEWVVEQWPGSATIIAVRSQGLREGKATREIRYYVTSLGTGAGALLRLIRQRGSYRSAQDWRLREFLAPGERRAAAGGRPPLPRRQRRPDPGHPEEPGDKCSETRWDVFDHRGHRGSGSRHQGLAQAVGMAGSHGGAALRMTSNRSCHHHQNDLGIRYTQGRQEAGQGGFAQRQDQQRGSPLQHRSGCLAAAQVCRTSETTQPLGPCAHGLPT